MTSQDAVAATPVASEAKAGGTPSSPVMVEDMDSISFQRLMEQRTRSKKQVQEYSLAQLRVGMNKLEQTLAGEIKRRVDNNQKLEEMARLEIQQMEQRLMNVLIKTSQTMETRLTNMEKSLEELQERFHESSQLQTESIQESSDQLQSKIDELQQQVQLQHNNSNVRQEHFAQQLESHALEFKQRWATEQQERQDALRGLFTTTQQETKQRQDQQDCWQDKIQTELALLQEELQTEIRERVKEDNVSAQALNAATTQLQKSLAFMGN